VDGRRDLGSATSGHGSEGLALSSTCRPGQLDDVEGIAATEPVQLVAHRPGKARFEQPACLLGTQRMEVQADDSALSGGGLDDGCETPRKLRRPKRHHGEHPALRRPSHEVREELDRRGIGPVKVVEREHHRAPPAESIEQVAHGLEGAMTVGRRRRGTGAEVSRQRREHRAELVELNVQIVQFTVIE
jgi:hypothetical protein